jgi:PleD family two-component response regulator
LTGITAEDQTLDSLFSRADAAMYEAKRQGKNRIIAA